MIQSQLFLPPEVEASLMMRFAVCQRLNVPLFMRLVYIKKKKRFNQRYKGLKSQANYELSLKFM